MADSPLKRGSWLVTLALAGGGLLYLFCAFMPNARSIHTLREEISSRQRFGAETPVLTAGVLMLKKQLDRTKAYVAENRRRLPSAAELPELGSRITREADLARTRTLRFEPQSPKDLAGLRMVPVAFDAQGSYGEIGKMLAGLESLPERIWVEEVKIEASRESAKDEQCVLKLTVFALNSENSD
ncbi:MAG TPA: type 4a pilus biogenesis protein PilO [Pirellulales bacterium]|jgi:Tfp pilus assembly protein PilO|nr:type 4a pilus biogenesis protein PilO [Pirellulales bacterium]